MCLKLDFHNKSPSENKTIKNKNKNIFLKVTQAFGETSLRGEWGETDCEYVFNVWEGVETLPEAGFFTYLLQNSFCLNPCETYKSYNCILL